jgi:two-component system OmpR family response regulator
MERIAILDDDKCIANFIMLGLKNESFHVDCFSQINELTDQLEQQTYDFLIMDRMIGKSDAVNWLKTIKLLAPRIKIIILSSLSGSMNRIKGLEMGADDYIEKPFHYDELKIRLSKLTSKDNHPKIESIFYSNIILNVESQKMHRAGKLIDLSPLEFRIMTIFLKNPNKIYSRTELLNSIWGINSDRSSNVVDVAIAKLRKKIHFNDELPLIHTRRGSGYQLSP